MDPLARLFSSSARLKLLRLFLFNDETGFSLADATFRVNVSKDTVRKELKVLMAAKVIRKRPGKEGSAYIANKRFPQYLALQNFMRATTMVSDTRIISLLKKAGSLRLVGLTGLFTDASETKADMIIVGDKLDEKRLDKAIHELEADLGRELRYAAFSTEDFRYRVGVYDRLVRDIFDYPHRLVLDKIGMQ